MNIIELRQSQKYARILFYTKVLIRMLADCNRTPEKVLRDAIKSAKSENWPEGGETLWMGLPMPMVGKLVDELVLFCKEVYPNDWVYFEAVAKNEMGAIVANPEPTTKIWALYYWYLRQGGQMPDLYHKKHLLETARKHGISEANFYQTFVAVGRNRDKNPKKPHILKEVIPLLSDWPDIQQKAQADLQTLSKHIEG